MTRKKEKEFEKEIDIDLGIAKFSLGSLFRGIEKLIDLADDLKEKGGEIGKEGEIDLSHLREGMKGVFGFSVRSSMGGKPFVESFGNIKKTPEGSVVVEEEREPLTDVFDEKNEILVISEIPGVEEEAITVALKGSDILEISAVSKNMSYRKEVLLPLQVKQENISYHYKNGILQIKIKK